MSSLWTNFDAKLQEAIKAIKNQVSLIDKESYAAKSAADNSHFMEIKSLIENKNPPVSAVHLPCYQLPYTRNAGYFGHTRALQACRAFITPQAKQTSLQSFALYGVGGVGKTSIALECTYTAKATFKVILWFTGDTLRKLSQGFANAAKSLFGSVSPDPDQDREKVKSWLCQTGVCTHPKSIRPLLTST